MAVVADTVVVELEARLDRYEANVKRAEQKFEKGMASIRKSSDRTARSIEKNNKQIAQTFRRLAATIAASFSAREIAQLVDGYTRLQNNLKVVGLEGENLARVQNELRAIGAQYGVEVESLSNVFLKASLAQQTLGASTQDIIELNRVVAASLKITGTSSEQARGALLQLGQALGSGVVRAEEFNSILEGALPIAQAAARGIEGFGGDVAKLRIAITKGQITSKQFFDGIKAGSEITLAQAEKATLTLAGAFTVLRNELTIYTGEAAKSSGATEALSSAILALADNLDTITTALSVIAAIFAGRFVAGAVAGAGALRTLSAFAAIATTSLAGTALAARAAGTALLGALGGPVGLAVSALLISIVALQGEVVALDRASREYKQRADETTAATRRLRQAQERLASAHGKTRVEALAAAKAERENTIQKLASARASLALAAVERSRANAEAKAAGRDTGTGGRFGFGRQTQAAVAQNRANANFEVERDNVIALRKAIKDITDVIDPKPVGNVSAAGTGKTKKGPKDRTAQIEERFNNELTSLAQSALAVRASLAKTANERAEFELRSLELARLNTKRSIENDKDLNESQRRRLLLELSSLSDLERRAIEEDRLIQIFEEQVQLAEVRFEAERGALEDALDVAVTQKDRRAILLDLVETEFKHREAALEALVANETIAEAERERAKIALEALRQAKAGQVRRAQRDSETPGERFARELSESAQKFDEEIESITVRGMKALNDQLADAIVNSENLGDVFKNVANSIIRDLVRIAIQRALIEPLANALFGGGDGSSGGGGGGGGLLGSIVGGITSIFKGRASGGNVVAGQFYQVNEGGGIEGFRPAGSGTIVPLGQMNTAQSNSGGEPAVQISMPISVVAPGANAQTVELIRQTIADTAPSIVQAAQKTTVAALSRKRITR